MDRDEIWKGALTFCKKCLTDHQNNLCISFKNEEGLDAGAMKAEFSEMILEQIQLRLFEEREFSKIPVKDSSKGLLLKIAGLVIAHAIAQGGPSFGALSTAVYFHIAGQDSDSVLLHLKKSDVPLHADMMPCSGV